MSLRNWCITCSAFAVIAFAIHCWFWVLPTFPYWSYALWWPIFPAILGMIGIWIFQRKRVAQIRWKISYIFWTAFRFIAYCFVAVVACAAIPFLITGLVYPLALMTILWGWEVIVVSAWIFGSFTTVTCITTVYYIATFETEQLRNLPLAKSATETEPLQPFQKVQPTKFNSETEFVAPTYTSRVATHSHLWSQRHSDWNIDQAYLHVDQTHLHADMDDLYSTSPPTPTELVVEKDIEEPRMDDSIRLSDCRVDNAASVTRSWSATTSTQNTSSNIGNISFGTTPRYQSY